MSDFAWMAAWLASLFIGLVGFVVLALTGTRDGGSGSLLRSAALGGCIGIVAGLLAGILLGLFITTTVPAFPLGMLAGALAHLTKAIRKPSRPSGPSGR